MTNERIPGSSGEGKKRVKRKPGMRAEAETRRADAKLSELEARHRAKQASIIGLRGNQIKPDDSRVARAAAILGQTARQQADLASSQRAERERIRKALDAESTSNKEARIVQFRRDFVIKTEQACARLEASDYPGGKLLDVKERQKGWFLTHYMGSTRRAGWLLSSISGSVSGGGTYEETGYAYRQPSSGYVGIYLLADETFYVVDESTIGNKRTDRSNRYDVFELLDSIYRTNAPERDGISQIMSEALVALDQIAI